MIDQYPPSLSQGDKDRPRANARFRLISDLELEAARDPEWIIEGILPAGALTMLFGAPNSTKSFIALSMALCITTGHQWHERQVRSGSVIYFAAEGRSGFKLRSLAWKQEHGWEGPSGIEFVDGSLDLLANEDVESFIDVIRGAGVHPRLIVIDTLARSFSGDENTAHDAGRAIRSLERIREATGATVLIVHHSRKADGVERGSSAFRGALDVMMYVSREKQEVSLQCRKMKDAAEFSDIPLRLIVRGKSCVLVNSEARHAEPDLTGQQRHCLSLLSNEPMTFTEWQRLCGIAGSSFAKVRERLLELGRIIQTSDGRYRLNPTAKEGEANAA